MPQVPYSHPFLSYEDLANLLLQRGMRGDVQEIRRCLEDVGYQRLQAYWATNPQGQINIDFETVWNQYCFDRQMRFLLMDAIERIEVAVRNRLVHYFTEMYGPFGYRDYSHFPHCKYDRWETWRDKLDIAAQKSSLKLVQDFFVKYTDRHLPLWLLCELMDFGSSVFFFSAVERQIKVKVSRALGVPNPIILESWLRALNDVRNACAHHNRVWNRGWVKTLPVPTNNADWHVLYDGASGKWIPGGSSAVAFNMRKTGGLLTICRCLLKQTAQTSRWKERLFALFAEDRFANLPIGWMGLPKEWQSHPLWKD